LVEYKLLMQNLHEAAGGQNRARRNALLVEATPLGREMLDLASALTGNRNLSSRFHDNPNIEPQLDVEIVNLSGHIMNVNLRPLDSVLEVKLMIKKQTGLFPHQFRLMWGEQPLGDTQRLYEYNIPAQGAVFTVVRTRENP
jgi:hypothetical protein